MAEVRKKGILKETNNDLPLLTYDSGLNARDPEDRKKRKPSEALILYPNLQIFE